MIILYFIMVIIAIIGILSLNIIFMMLGFIAIDKISRNNNGFYMYKSSINTIITSISVGILSVYSYFCFDTLSGMINLNPTIVGVTTFVTIVLLVWESYLIYTSIK